LERLGFNLNKEELGEAYHRFLTVADSKLDINDDDLLLMMGKQQLA
jgi:2-isopropylmalate synthase